MHPFMFFAFVRPCFSSPLLKALIFSKSKHLSTKSHCKLLPLLAKKKDTKTYMISRDAINRSSRYKPSFPFLYFPFRLGCGICILLYPSINLVSIIALIGPLLSMKPGKILSASLSLSYMAPKLFYKSIGDVLYKADVYSFGMLLMVMVGRRKNAEAKLSSEIYFPTWIYDRIQRGEDMDLGDVSEELKTLAWKMTFIALWCIQMKPIDHPSMSNVLDMLEGDAELLQIPPKPSFYPP